MSKQLFIDELPNPLFCLVNPFVRALTVLPVGILATACLLWAMQALVHQDHTLEIPNETPKIPPIIMNELPRITTQIEEPPARPVEVMQPPKIELASALDIEPGTDAVGLGGPIVTEKPAIKGIAGISGQMIPFIKVPPQYPASALARGVEGYVEVVFDVTELGTTDNIRIVHAEPSSIFNRAVLKAIKNWKYKPNVVDGQPVRTPDVRDRVTFAMEK